MSHFSDPATFCVLISFIIFVVAFIRLAGKAITSRLDARIADIRKEISTAESLRIEAQELLAQYQRKQREAAKEAQAIIDNARKHAEQIGKQAEADLDAAIKRREQQMNDRLRRMEAAAVQEIRAYASELAVKATAEIIAKKMDEQNNSRLIDASIKQVMEQLG
jgi:F-type H+-transporting ATPase subunit b